MSIRLIVNSDDYGRSAGISRGIREAHLRGIVSSTTCMMNFPTTDEDIAIALKETPELGLGVHLVMTAGRPLLPAEQVSSLIMENGSFPKPVGFEARLHELDAAEAKAEWRTQIEKFIGVAGRNPTHLDSHHHAAYYTEPLFQAMLELAQEYGCAIRLPSAQLAGETMYLDDRISEFAGRLCRQYSPRTPDAFFASFYDDQATIEEIVRLINLLPDPGIYEIMCHPGYSDPELVASTVYAVQRERELAILTHDEVREAIEARDIELINFGDLTD
jgi:predicted glycoside hydrolase/deacetylase ChbG (UPF0249 family)